MPEILCARGISGDIDGARFVKGLDEIRVKSGGSVFVASVNPSCICSVEHLHSVFRKAVRSFRSGRSRSRTMEGEFFRLLAMELQMSRAIKRCGLSEKTPALCLVYEGIGPERIASLIEEFRMTSMRFPLCTPEKLSSLGFKSVEELFEAVAFFDVGIRD